MRRIFQFFRESYAELRKVSWPSREEVGNSTRIVLISVALIALVLGLIDFVSVYSTVTDLKDSTSLPFLTFIYSCKIDKKGQITEGEYSDFDIGFTERY